MSFQELPLIKNLRESVEKEAVQTAKKHRQSLGQSQNCEKKQQEQASTEVQQETKQEPKIVIDENKLFDKKLSIFGYKSENNSSLNIFANRKSVNLFNINTKQPNLQKSINIFKLASSSQPIIKNQLEDDLLSQSSQGPQEILNQQVLKQPEQKIMKYNYEEKTTKFGEFKVVKFKNGGGATREGKMIVSLQKQKDGDSKILYLILRSEATKVTLYQAILVPNGKIEHFLNKQQNIKLWAIRSHKKEENVVTEREILKIQFENTEEAKRFVEFFVKKEETKDV